MKTGARALLKRQKVPGYDQANYVTERLWAVARDPLKVLPVIAVIALLAIALPLTVTGLTRAGRGAMDWQRRSTIDWHRASARVEQVKIDDGLILRLHYRDHSGAAHEVDTFVGDASGKWVGRTVRIRYAYCPFFQFSSEKAARELGYAPGPLEPAIADAIAWFRARGML